MNRLDEIKQEFSVVNARAGEHFAAIADSLEDRIEPGELDAWAELSLSIATSGWHAWETSNVWCDISADLLQARGAEALLACGRYGFALCGYSFEPSATYFKGVGGLLASGMVEKVAPIELAGEAIRSKFSQASSLITDYFRTAFGLAVSNDISELQDWSDIAVDMAALSRAELMAFFEASRGVRHMGWPFIRQLSRVSVAAGLDYMHASRLLELVGPDNEASLQRSVLRFADGAETITEWLDELAATAAGLSPPERGRLIGLIEAVPQVEMAQSLLKGAGRLPWARPEVLDDWIKGLDAYLPLNVEAACGYLAVESATSVDRLERLLGRVNLSDCQRVLQLYSEAIAGQHLLIDALSEEMEDFRGLPTTDGICIYLPESISRYAAREDNFALYKAALLHQLGYYEFGTFRFAWHGSLIAFNDFFGTFGDPGLAAAIFQVLEDARVDWALARRYRGAATQLARFKADAAAALPVPDSADGLAVCMDVLLRASLDATPGPVPAALAADATRLRDAVLDLASTDADVYGTMDALARCYTIIAAHGRAPDAPRQAEAAVTRTLLPEIDIEFRGRLEPDRARLNLTLINPEEEDVEFAEDGDTMTLSFPVDPKNVTIEQLKRGDVQEALGMMITELEGMTGEEEELTDEQRAALEEFRGAIAAQSGPVPDAAYRYDEWDCVIEDYRRRWCTLYEITNLDEHPEFVEATLRELPAVARKVRRQLNNLKPELLRKVKGVLDGEDLDLERAVELMVDKRAGMVPEERIYIERLRKDRDVSALFLLDMSASTDDRIPETAVDEQRSAPPWDKDDFLHDYQGAGPETDKRKRIIDLEKEAVVLMAEALEGLGDSYSVCGFSGYGKDQVDFYLCKDFEEPYNLRSKGRIGGMKPCRSTRMGPAIRHATRRLVATESRIKAMIIISDGYPQDFDYGKDRNSKDYGIKDTTMALSEARQKGVQTFCLTVDPSGHDYLREMCPDHQYMVIQDINQLPDELSKVYRSLTG